MLRKSTELRTLVKTVLKISFQYSIARDSASTPIVMRVRTGAGWSWENPGETKPGNWGKDNKEILSYIRGWGDEWASDFD